MKVVGETYFYNVDCYSRNDSCTQRVFFATCAIFCPNDPSEFLDGFFLETSNSAGIVRENRPRMGQQPFILFLFPPTQPVPRFPGRDCEWTPPPTTLSLKHSFLPCPPAHRPRKGKWGVSAKFLGAQKSLVSVRPFDHRAPKFWAF